jgi:hypothetical protein
MMTLAFGPSRLARGVMSHLILTARRRKELLYVCDCGEHCLLSGRTHLNVTLEPRGMQGLMACRCGTRFVIRCQLPAGVMLRRGPR